MAQTHERNHRNRMSEQDRQEERETNAQRNRDNYQSGGVYRQEQLKKSEQQRQDPKWFVKRAPKKVPFTIGQFRKRDNPTGELPPIGDFQQSKREGVWCKHCGAYYFRAEVNDKGIYTNCCMNGKLKNHLLIDEEFPEELIPFYKPDPNNRDQMRLSKIFKENIIRLNNIFAMTSFGGKKKILWSTVKVHGKIMHKMDHLLAEDQTEASFAQVYFLNENDQLQQRMKNLRNMINYTQRNKYNEKEQKKLQKKLKQFEKQEASFQEIVKTFQTVIQKENAFVERYKSAYEKMEDENLENVKIVFKCNNRPKGTHARDWDI